MEHSSFWDRSASCIAWDTANTGTYEKGRVDRDLEPNFDGSSFQWFPQGTLFEVAYRYKAIFVKF